MSELVLELIDLGFVKETLIFQTWSFGILFGQKDGFLEASCSAKSLSENRGGKPLKLDALVSPGTSDRVKMRLLQI